MEAGKPMSSPHPAFNARGGKVELPPLDELFKFTDVGRKSVSETLPFEPAVEVW